MHNPLSMRQVPPLPLAMHAALPRGGWMQRELSVDGASAHVQLWAEDRARGAAAMAEALAEMHRVVRLSSATRAEAELAVVNEQAGLSAVPVSDELFQMAARAHELARATAGRYSAVTASGGTLRPDAWQQLVLDATLPTLRLSSRGLRLCLRRLARGWAVDRAMLLLQRRGIGHAYVELGTSRRTLGRRPDGQDWTLALRDPRQHGQTLAWLPVQDLAVATAQAARDAPDADDGTRAAAAGLPRDGSPEAGTTVVASATVVASDGVAAAAWAQALRQRAVADALAQAQQQPELSVLLIDTEGRLHASGGIAAESADGHARTPAASRSPGGDRLLVRPS